MTMLEYGTPNLNEATGNSGTDGIGHNILGSEGPFMKPQYWDQGRDNQTKLYWNPGASNETRSDMCASCRP
jgi:hypothetical protein